MTSYVAVNHNNMGPDTDKKITTEVRIPSGKISDEQRGNIEAILSTPGVIECWPGDPDEDVYYVTLSTLRVISCRGFQIDALTDTIRKMDGEKVEALKMQPTEDSSVHEGNVDEEKRSSPPRVISHTRNINNLMNRDRWRRAKHRKYETVYKSAGKTDSTWNSSLSTNSSSLDTSQSRTSSFRRISSTLFSSSNNSKCVNLTSTSVGFDNEVKTKTKHEWSEKWSHIASTYFNNSLTNFNDIDAVEMFKHFNEISPTIAVDLNNGLSDLLKCQNVSQQRSSPTLALLEQQPLAHSEERGLFTVSKYYMSDDSKDQIRKHSVNSSVPPVPKNEMTKSDNVGFSKHKQHTHSYKHQIPNRQSKSVSNSLHSSLNKSRTFNFKEMEKALSLGSKVENKIAQNLNTYAHGFTTSMDRTKSEWEQPKHTSRKDHSLSTHVNTTSSSCSLSVRPKLPFPCNKRYIKVPSKGSSKIYIPSADTLGALPEDLHQVPVSEHERAQAAPSAGEQKRYRKTIRKNRHDSLGAVPEDSHAVYSLLNHISDEGNTRSMARNYRGDISRRFTRSSSAPCPSKLEQIRKDLLTAKNAILKANKHIKVSQPVSVATCITATPSNTDSGINTHETHITVSETNARKTHNTASGTSTHLTHYTASDSSTHLPCSKRPGSSLSTSSTNTPSSSMASSPPSDVMGVQLIVRQSETNSDFSDTGNDAFGSIMSSNLTSNSMTHFSSSSPSVEKAGWFRSSSYAASRESLSNVC